jgi:hypothetical protein
MPVFDKSGEF